MSRRDRSARPGPAPARSLRGRRLRAGIAIAFVGAACGAAPAWAQLGNGDALASEVSEPRGALIPISWPEGAYVFLDGRLLGRTPMDPVPVPPGEHRVWFRTRAPLEFEPQPLPERTFVAIAGDTTVVDEKMGALVRVDSEPAGAIARIGKREIGRTPLVIRWLARNGETLTLHHDGCLPREIEGSELAAGELFVRLRVVDPGSSSAPVSSSSGSAVNWKGWGGLGLSAASALLAVHFKDRADDAYDRYRRSALPSRMESHLDDAERYDRYSTVAWVAAESSFIVALWFFARPILGLSDQDGAPHLAVREGRTEIGATWRY